MNANEQKPSVLIVSSSNTKPKSLIKLITRNTNVLDNDPNKTSQSWQIDTKYYTANVNIHGITENYVRNEEFNGSVEAMIVHMDSNKDTGLQDLQKWEAIERDCDPEIKLLVSNYCTNETKITKAKATEWCLKRGYELIELYPSTDKKSVDGDEDAIIKEKFGVDRIIEALQTHLWPNLEMKNHGSKTKADVEHKQGDSKQKDSAIDACGELQMDPASLLDDFLTDEGTVDFTEIFTQLHMMKESIQSMPIRERKQCAEQMVTAFWGAIGGDEEEIADL